VFQEGHSGRRVHVDHRWQPLPYRRWPARTGHRVLCGVLRRGRANGGRQTGGVRVRLGHRNAGHGCGHTWKLEVPHHSGRFRAVCCVLGAHAARVRHTVRPPERPRLLRHVLRGLPAPVDRLPNDPPVDTGRHKWPPVHSIWYVYLLLPLFD